MLVEVIVMRQAGKPLPAAERRPPWRGILSVEKVAGRRVARLVTLEDSPNAGPAPVLLDPVFLKMIGDSFVLAGLEEVWATERQGNEEMPQSWGCRRIG